MREIKINQFSSTQELKRYFDDFANDGFGTPFFFDRVNNTFFVDQVENQNIRIWEYDYLCPISDIQSTSGGNLILSPERKMILERYKRNGSIIGRVRENVLMFLNTNFTEVEVISGNILVDHKSKSAIFTGSFSLPKLLSYITSSSFDETENIYVFPYHEQNDTTAPFHIERFLKIWISKKVKIQFLKTQHAIMKEAASKIYF